METESIPFISPFHIVMQEDRAHLRHPNSWGIYGPGCSGTNGHEAPEPPARRRQTSGPTPRQTRGRADTVRCSASHAGYVTTRASQGKSCDNSDGAPACRTIDVCGHSR